MTRKNSLLELPWVQELQYELKKGKFHRRRQHELRHDVAQRTQSYEHQLFQMIQAQRNQWKHEHL